MSQVFTVERSKSFRSLDVIQFFSYISDSQIYLLDLLSNFKEIVWLYKQRSLYNGLEEMLKNLGIEVAYETKQDLINL